MRAMRLVEHAKAWRALWWPGLRPLAIGLAACLALLFAFALIADEVVEDGRDGFDRAVEAALHGWSHPMLTGSLRVLTELGSSVVTGVVCLLLAAWLVRRGRPLAAVLTFLTWAGGQLAVEAAKAALRRTRPDLFAPLVRTDGYSFPSGHTCAAVIAYGLVAAVLAARWRDRGRRRLLPWAGWAVVVAVVAFSRVYLGAHHPTDVVGSLLFAGAWLLAALLVIDVVEHPRRFLPARSQPAVARTDRGPPT